MANPPSASRPPGTRFRDRAQLVAYRLKAGRLVRAIFLFTGLTLVLGLAYLFYLSNCDSDWCLFFDWQRVRATDSYEECVGRGFPVAPGDPPLCRAGDKFFRPGDAA